MGDTNPRKKPAVEPDVFIGGAVALRPNLLVSYYLMLSWLYYECDQSLVPDTFFDHICRRLLDEWDSITHSHKSLISKESLAAGTGYDIVYPSVAIHAARDLWNRFHPENPL